MARLTKRNRGSSAVGTIQETVNAYAGAVFRDTLTNQGIHATLEFQDPKGGGALHCLECDEADLETIEALEEFCRRWRAAVAP